MEKQAVIAPGITPKENDNVKEASTEQLAEHPTKRAADVVERTCKCGKKLEKEAKQHGGCNGART